MHDCALVKMQEGAMQGLGAVVKTAIFLGSNLCGVVYKWSLNINYVYYKGGNGFMYAVN